MIFVGALLLQLVAVQYVVLPGPQVLEPMPAFHLQAATMLLERSLPGLGLLDVDAPLLTYLSVLPVLLGRALGLHVITAFQIILLGLGLWSTLAVARGLRRLPLRPEHMSLVTLGWALFLALLARQQEPFGQREHLFLLFFGPLLPLRFARWTGVEVPPQQSTPSLLGFFAGLTLCLRPQFLLLLLAVEVGCWTLRRERGERLRAALWAPELAAIAVAAALHLSHSLLLSRALGEGLFSRVSPLRRGTEALEALPLSLVAHSAGPWLLALGLAFLTVEALRRRLRPTHPAVAPLSLAPPLFALCAMGLLLCLAQKEGLPRHLLPVQAGMVLLGACSFPALLGSLDGVRLPRLVRRGVFLAPSLLSLGVGAGLLLQQLEVVPDPFGRSGGAARRVRSLSAAIASHVPPRQEAMVLAVDQRAVYPLLTQLDRRPASRHPWLAALPLALRRRAPTGAEPSPEEQRLLRELAEDLSRARPALVAVAVREECPACPAALTTPAEAAPAAPGSFHTLAYLEGRGFLRDVVEPAYERQAEPTLDGFVVYTLRGR